MDYQIILVYCLCADLLLALQHHEDSQCQMSDAEVMTAAIVAALYFGGKYKLACQFLAEQGYMPQMLSKSQFSRRLQRLEPLLLSLFRVLGESFKALNDEEATFVGAVSESLIKWESLPTNMKTVAMAAPAKAAKPAAKPAKKK